MKELINTLLTEIDELYERKRANTAQFKGQEREYQLLRDAARKKFQSELTRKKSVEKQAQQAALRRERRSVRVIVTPVDPWVCPIVSGS